MNKVKKNLYIKMKAFVNCNCYSKDINKIILKRQLNAQYIYKQIRKLKINYEWECVREIEYYEIKNSQKQYNKIWKFTQKLANKS